MMCFVRDSLGSSVFFDCLGRKEHVVPQDESKELELRGLFNQLIFMQRKRE